ncbi:MULTISPECIES: hypothetical protein [Pseudanabaena]|uniref:hypothetical protein n=1 Tax=Pseudanabaena TaxID=1152 RepID=UPI0024786C7C|nr:MULTISPECIES: hypothetical protein [Pseudanabaena]MEA5486790.1 hypothetical protein [Pseudanabaena sp. CCNP1317]WGS74795.1 hypothetical protein OA858_22625 [Pseudanabaena galeata CCNP1313]
MSSINSENFKFNLSTLSIANLNDEDKEDRAYWLLKSPKERLIALEYLRQVLYGYDPNTFRLQRIFEIAKLPSS